MVWGGGAVEMEFIQYVYQRVQRPRWMEIRFFMYEIVKWYVE